MKTFNIDIGCVAPYPFETRHTVTKTSMRAAVGVAIDEHRATLRERGALRKRGKSTTITIVEV